MIVLDGVVDAGGSQKRVEPALVRGLVVVFENRLYDLFLGESFARFDGDTLGPIIIHMESQHVSIIDGVGDGVGMELIAEHVFSGYHAGLLAFDGAIDGVLLEDRCAGKAKELSLWEMILDCLVIIAKLRAMTFIEDNRNAIVAQRFQALLVGLMTSFLFHPIALTVFIQRKPELLDGGHDYLIGVVVGEEALD